jgi:hypothetical protein
MWAMAKLRFLPPQCAIDAWAAGLAEAIPLLTDSELKEVVWNSSTLGADLGDIIHRQLENALANNVDEIATTTLVTALSAMATSSRQPANAANVAALLESGFRRLPRDQSQDQELAQGGAKASGALKGQIAQQAKNRCLSYPFAVWPIRGVVLPSVHLLDAHAILPTFAHAKRALMCGC